jgi:cytoskeletal protein CcmA (bactofilin family)
MFQKTVPDTSPEITRPVPTHDDDVETVVGPSVHVEGDFASEGNILVKGSVSGNVKTSKLLTVEHGAKIFANVRAGSAHISGEIKGSVRVQDRLELSSSAQILGDITCSVLAVEPGALIQGKLSMRGISIENNEKSAPKRSTRRRRSSEDETIEESEA